jgi:hypothetical protein
MAAFFGSLVERMIRSAERDGAFDNLAGAGAPLDQEGDPHEAALKRMMGEAQIIPPAVVLKQQINASYARLKGLSGAAGRKAEMARLADLQMRLAMELERSGKYR